MHCDDDDDRHKQEVDHGGEYKRNDVDDQM